MVALTLRSLLTERAVFVQSDPFPIGSILIAKRETFLILFAGTPVLTESEKKKGLNDDQ